MQYSSPLIRPSLEAVIDDAWGHCVRMSNGAVELLITAELGPRIIRAGLAGGPNLLREYPDHRAQRAAGQWRLYGGHRLWHAPEDPVRTYQPDNDPVEVRLADDRLIVTQRVESLTSIEKELEIAFGATPGRLTVTHRLRNRGKAPQQLAPWALTLMCLGGTAIIPQEPFAPHGERLLPARPMALWSYTNMADPRVTWGQRFIRVRQDTALRTPWKVGVRNSQGWIAYAVEDTVFVKQTRVDPAAVYPDMNSSHEVYTMAGMIELETLGPLTVLEPGGPAAEHTEEWLLSRTRLGSNEDEMAANLAPLVAALS